MTSAEGIVAKPAIVLCDDDKDVLRHFGSQLQTHYAVRIANSRERFSHALTVSPPPIAVLYGEAFTAREGIAPLGGNGLPVWIPLQLPVSIPRLFAHLQSVAGVALEPAASHLAGRRALIAEDDPMLRQILGEHLAALSIGYATVGDGAQVLDRCRLERFDWVLMDVHMPIMDGLEATRRLRAQAATAQTVIIACTATDDPGSRRECEAAGMTDFLVKPFEPAALEALLLAHLPRPNPT